MTQKELDSLDLPDDLQIRSIFLPDVSHYGVFCKKTVINKSTRFGPFPGKSVYPSELKSNKSLTLTNNNNNNHMWEVFNDGRLNHFIDGRSSINNTVPSKNSNNSKPNQWMIYVNCARFAQEQNLIAVQVEGEIYYEVCKDIPQVIIYFNRNFTELSFIILICVF
jgi:PR domain zinc finger protein 14